MKNSGVLKGVIISLVVTGAVILILAFVTYFTEAQSRVITIGMYAGVIFSVVLGAFAAARSSERRVLLHAMLVSVIYLALLIIVSAAVNHTLRFNVHFFTMTAGILASGFLGAVAGK